MNRRHLLGSLLGACLPACSSETVEMWPAAPAHFLSGAGPQANASPLTPTARERALADVYCAALASAHFAELTPILDEQARITFGAHGTHGRDRVLAGHEEAFGAFDERKFVTTRLWLTDSTHPLDSQAYEWTMTGVHARDFRGIAASQKPIVIKGLTLLWTTDDGIISDVHIYFDEEVVMAQLGGGKLDPRKLPAPETAPPARQILERSGTPEELSNAKTGRAMVQALEDGDEKAFLATLAEDIVVISSDRAEPLRGKAAAHEYYKTLRRSIRLLDTVIQNDWGVGSFAVIEYAITGLQLAPLPRIPFAEGRPLHTQFVDIAEFRNGQIASIWRYADPISFASL